MAVTGSISVILYLMLCFIFSSVSLANEVLPKRGVEEGRYPKHLN